MSKTLTSKKKNITDSVDNLHQHPWGRAFLGSMETIRLSLNYCRPLSSSLLRRIRRGKHGLLAGQQPLLLFYGRPFSCQHCSNTPLLQWNEIHVGNTWDLPWRNNLGPHRSHTPLTAPQAWFPGCPPETLPTVRSHAILGNPKPSPSGIYNFSKSRTILPIWDHFCHKQCCLVTHMTSFPIKLLGD